MVAFVALVRVALAVALKHVVALDDRDILKHNLFSMALESSVDRSTFHRLRRVCQLLTLDRLCKNQSFHDHQLFQLALVVGLWQSLRKARQVRERSRLSVRRLNIFIVISSPSPKCKPTSEESWVGASFHQGREKGIFASSDIQAFEIGTFNEENVSRKTLLVDEDYVCEADGRCQKSGDIFLGLHLWYVRVINRVLKSARACCACETSDIRPFNSVRKRRWSRESENVSADGVIILLSAMISPFHSDSTVRTGKYYRPSFHNSQTSWKKWLYSRLPLTNGARVSLLRGNKPLVLTLFRSVRKWLQKSANVSSMSLAIENINQETYFSRHLDIYFFTLDIYIWKRKSNRKNK